MQTFLAYFDQFRYMGSWLAILIVLCHTSLTPRDHYSRRIAVSTAICLLLAFAFVPINKMLQPHTQRIPMLIAPYWLVMSFVPLGLILYCYETHLTAALFQLMISAFSENIATIFTRNLFVYILFPTLPQTHPLLYIGLMVIFYAAYVFLVCRVWGHRLAQNVVGRSGEDRNTSLGFIAIYLLYAFMMNSNRYNLEHTIPPIAQYAALWRVHRILAGNLIANLFLLDTLMIVILWFVYLRLSERTEKETIARLARERQTQYEFSREVMELINQKSHDLKHQMLALSMLPDEERQRQLKETKQMVELYDAVVHTGNEALDTLLTEKQIYCVKRDIRLSCTVRSEKLEKVALVDLYVLLGNALDNAIESVERLEQPEMRNISLTILDRGDMLYMQVENYYDGILRFDEDMPQTRKEDTLNHGFGLRSIRTIARQYGGTMDIRTEDNLFFLDLVIPI